MKQIYFLILVLICGATFSGCRNGGGGELTGVPQRNFRSEVPFGMVYIPAGSFLMGQTDQDITFSQIAQTKQVTVPAFFMDQTAITNSQYKQFVFWVRDSIAITNFLNDDKYYFHPKGATGNTGKKYINWAYVKKYPVWNAKKGQQGAGGGKLDGMYYQGDDRVFDKNEIDVRLLKYNYSQLILRTAADYRTPYRFTPIPLFG
jgi:sulfatase modifying factor 1